MVDVIINIVLLPTDEYCQDITTNPSDVQPHTTPITTKTKQKRRITLEATINVVEPKVTANIWAQR